MFKHYYFYIRLDVPEIGLEPTHLAVPEPKSGVSANFTTRAKTWQKSTIFKKLLARRIYVR